MNADSIQIRIAESCTAKKAGNVDVIYYPNPTDGDFTIMLSSLTSETASINISTINNKQVFRQQNIPVFGINTLHINLKSVAQGTYIINIRTNTGETSDKIVVGK